MATSIYFCKDCIYFNTPDSTCRENSPTVLGTSTSGITWVWPKVSPTLDWCANGKTVQGWQFAPPTRNP